jgi:DNA-binding NarL/FixJ family response regulator
MTLPSAMLRILVIEDDARYRDSLEVLVRATTGLELAGSFGRPLAALAWLDDAAGPAPFDVALLDIELPDLSGIEVARRLRARAPDAALVMLTVFEEPGTIVEAICAGADGYLLKKTSARELVAQVRAVADGGAPMTAAVARTVLEVVRRTGGGGSGGAGGAAAPTRLELTGREQDVLRALVRGLSYKQVAAELGMSIDTVRTHVRALYKKLQVHSVAAAVTRAIRDRLV